MFISIQLYRYIQKGCKNMNNKKKRKAIQCKYCIQVLHGNCYNTPEQQYARHIHTKHPEHEQDYINGEL